jgi:cysteine desulfurase
VGQPLYLDHPSTTPVDPRVVEAMAPYWTERFGHPASRHHAYGWDAEHAVDAAREEVAQLIGAEAREIVFTSGGTEADNLALKGVAEALASKGRHLVTTAIENRPVADSCAWLEGRGWEVTRVGVDGAARVDPAAIDAAIRDDTVLVSVQWANPEVGTVQPMHDIGAVCEARGVLLHTDATQAAAWLPIDVRAAGVHLLSVTAHRLYGPKGTGALYVRRKGPRVRLAPQIHGGGHEGGLRSGTVNVPGVVGLGRAAAICRAEGASDARRVGALRDRLEAGLVEGSEGARALGSAAHRLPGVLSVTVRDVEGEALLLGASGLAFSTGSACSSATLEPSPVLGAMGLSKRDADSSVRLGLGRFTTQADVDAAIGALTDAVARIRAAGA